jgi:hypothetical protein
MSTLIRIWWLDSPNHRNSSQNVAQAGYRICAVWLGCWLSR